MQTATHVFIKKRVKPVTPVVKPLEKRVKPVKPVEPSKKLYV